MTFNTQLRIPGPTPLPERVVRSMSRPMIDHRGPEFAAILGEITARAKRIFKTKHDPTSTGLTNPLRELGGVARDADRTVVVDGVSSVSSIDIETDAWGIDVAVSGSQKGWMSPPGMALVSVSERAWAQQAKARSPRFYFDWKEAKTWAEKGMTPFTPAIQVAFAMQEGLHMLEEEGLSNVYE